MTFAEKLKTLRKQKGWSQTKLANELGVSRQSVSKWEQSEVVPDTSNLEKISKVFNMPTENLLQEEIDIVPQYKGVIKQERKNNSYVFSLLCVLAGLLILCSILILSYKIPSRQKVVSEIDKTDIFVLEGKNDFNEAETVVYFTKTFGFIPFINTYYLHWLVVLSAVLIIYPIVSLIKRKRVNVSYEKNS